MDPMGVYIYIYTIYLNSNLIDVYRINVSKYTYTSPMDPMGWVAACDGIFTNFL